MSNKEPLLNKSPDRGRAPAPVTRQGSRSISQMSQKSKRSGSKKREAEASPNLRKMKTINPFDLDGGSKLVIER